MLLIFFRVSQLLLVMQFTDEQLAEEVTKGNSRAISRVISLIENSSPRARPIQKRIFKNAGRAHVIGITGSPGAGKSTLVDGLAVSLRAQGQKVAILAIDPSSPFSGGAILGDRIRMTKTLEDSSVFVRSMATRGALGGISRATLDAIQVLDAGGFETVIVETVGVGQAEVDIVRTADSCVVVLVPGMGDSVQAIKAGILEIADIFVVNKADREGADHLRKDLTVLLSLADYGDADWKPEIVNTVATTLVGVPELTQCLAKHREWLRGSEEGRKRKLRVLKDMIMKLAADLTMSKVSSVGGKDLELLAQQCFERKKDPYSVAQELLKKAGLVVTA